MKTAFIQIKENKRTGAHASSEEALTYTDKNIHVFILAIIILMSNAETSSFDLN